MSLFNTEKIEKLTLIGHNIDGKPINEGEFVSQFNPTSIEMSQSPCYNKQMYPGKIGSEMQWKNTEPKTFSLKLILDGTGVGRPNTDIISYADSFFSKSPPSVGERIALFEKNTISYRGDDHQPPLYTQITWGEFMKETSNVFKGRITSLNITYTLFRANGDPLRAELSSSFTEYMSEDEMLKTQKKSSPDMTHQRTVQAGDTLPMMTQRIYGDAKYYKQVAAYNQLTSLRTLEPGTQLIFPPLES